MVTNVWKPVKTKKEYKALLKSHGGSAGQVAKAIGISKSKVITDIERLGLKEFWEDIKPLTEKKLARTMEEKDEKNKGKFIDHTYALKNLPILATALRKGKYSETQLCNMFGLTSRQFQQLLSWAYKEGYLIKSFLVGTDIYYWIPMVASPDDKVYRHYLKGAKEVTFALVADTHMASKKEAFKELCAFYDIIHERGIKKVYHAGDITEGRWVYAGQDNELKFTGVDEITGHTTRNYPQRPNVKTCFITGNHDDAIFKKTGTDVGNKIIGECKIIGRTDLEYLGQLYARAEILPHIYLDLVHPDGGMPYAVSYKAQKYVESIEGGTKPNILVRGHLHQNLYMTKRGIHIFEAGCFQRQTKFLLRKGIQPQIGGWIITVKAHGRTIRSIKAEWIQFY